MKGIGAKTMRFKTNGSGQKLKPSSQVIKTRCMVESCENCGNGTAQGMRGCKVKLTVQGFAFIMQEDKNGQ